MSTQTHLLDTSIGGLPGIGDITATSCGLEITFRKSVSAFLQDGDVCPDCVAKVLETEENVSEDSRMLGVVVENVEKPIARQEEAPTERVQRQPTRIREPNPQNRAERRAAAKRNKRTS